LATEPKFSAEPVPIRVQTSTLTQSSHQLGTRVIQSKELSSTGYASTTIDGRRTPIPSQVTRLYQSQTLPQTEAPRPKTSVPANYIRTDPRPKTSVPANYISSAPRPRTSVPANYVTKLSASPESSDSLPMNYISSHDKVQRSSNDPSGKRWSFPGKYIASNSEPRSIHRSQTQNPKILTQERRTEGPQYSNSSYPVRRSISVTPQPELRLSQAYSESFQPKKSILRTSTGGYRPSDQPIDKNVSFSRTAKPPNTFIPASNFKRTTAAGTIKQPTDIFSIGSNIYHHYNRTVGSNTLNGNIFLGKGTPGVGSMVGRVSLDRGVPVRSEAGEVGRHFIGGK
jgi:hypothetical protein